jgi:hypothetical protein
MTRQQANKKILKLLKAHIEKYPDERFSQILYNLAITMDATDTSTLPWRDDYNMEPSVLLERIEQSRITNK